MAKKKKKDFRDELISSLGGLKGVHMGRWSTRRKLMFQSRCGVLTLTPRHLENTGFYNREILKKILQGGDQNIPASKHTLDYGPVVVLKYISNFYDFQG